MAIIKKKDLINMSAKELDKKLTDLRSELIKSRGLSASKAAPDNPGKVKAIKRLIARILTLKKQRGMN